MSYRIAVLHVQRNCIADMHPGQRSSRYCAAGGAIVCNGTTVTHAVQTIGCGYILQNNAYVPVYIIKNQWSQYWVGPRITSGPASPPC
jgi:hypothetical protein